MHGASRRGVAIVAASATLGAALVAPAPSSAQSPLGGLVGTVTKPVTDALGLPADSTITEVVASLDGLPTGEVTTIIEELGSGDPQTAVNSLQALAGGLLSDNPLAATGVDALIEQLGLASLVPGVDAAAITAAIQDALTKIAAGDVAGGAQVLADALTKAGTQAGGGTPTGGTGTAGGTGGTGTGTKAPTFTAFHAKVQKVKVAKNRRSAKLRISCPAIAPGCIVVVTGKVLGMTAFKQKGVAVTPGKTRGVKVKLARGARLQLRSRKGGRLKVTATTIGSTIGPASKSSARVRRAK